MLLTIADLLNNETCARIRSSVKKLKWRHGTVTAGATAKAVKQNQQADLTSPEGADLHDEILSILKANPVLSAAARPKRFSHLLLSQTSDEGHYGPHIDNALMNTGDGKIRTDLSFALFLSEPETYEGGELTIHQPGMVQELKPAAGDLVLYPSTSIHEVKPVTKGVRLVFAGWIESMVPDPVQREILFDLENLRTTLRGNLPDQSVEMLTLSKNISNLLRLWANP